MVIEVLTEYQCEDITDAMIANAARFFSEHYGVWGCHPPDRHGGKPGDRIKMSADRLRSHCLPDGARCSYVNAVVDGVLAGHAFACRWEYQGRQVCWITQIVVHSNYRECRLATRILAKLAREEDEVFGIISSHPAACMALFKACGDAPSIPGVDFDFARAHAAAVMAGSPIAYVREAELRGRLFWPVSNPGGWVGGDLICGVDSNFFPDHKEPFLALAWLQNQIRWPFGQLYEGHEFLFVFESSRLARSRFLSEARFALADTLDLLKWAGG